MLYIPLFVFLLNGSFNHAQTVDTPMTRAQCSAFTAELIAQNPAPEGVKVLPGCIPLPEGTTIAPKEPVPTSKQKTTKL